MPTEKQRARKKWIPIFASGEFDKIKLGESYVHSAKDLLHKQLTLNLMTLTNDPKKQSVNVVFCVNHIEGDCGVADLIGYRMNMAHVRRVVRKGVGRLDDSFTLQSKDNMTFVVKPLLIARYKMKGSVATAIRKKTREHLHHVFQSLKRDGIFLSAISNKLQMDLKSELRKIYPLALSEIRVLNVVSPQKTSS